MADYTRGAGGDPNNPPAPQGQATATNAAAASVPPPQSDTPAPQPQDASGGAGVEGPGTTGATQDNTPPNELQALLGSGPAPTIPTPTMGTDQQKFLYSDSTRPGESVLAGATPTGRLAPPPDLWDWLPDLRDTASVPDAPVAVRELYDSIASHLAMNGITY